MLVVVAVVLAVVIDDVIAAASAAAAADSDAADAACTAVLFKSCLKAIIRCLRIIPEAKIGLDLMKVNHKLLYLKCSCQKTRSP